MNRIRLTLLVAAACSIAAASASAHHILGVPHYNYEEQYPQTPVLTYRVELHGWEVEMTGFPGKPDPGDRISLHAYIRRIDTGEVLDDTVTLTVTRDRLFGSGEVVYGPMDAQLEESMYKFFPEFPVVGRYTAELAFKAGGEDWVIELPMEAGEPTSPWALIGGATAAVFLLLLVVRALLIKHERKLAARAVPITVEQTDTTEAA